MHPNQLRLFPLTRPDAEHKSGKPLWKDFPEKARQLDDRLSGHRERGGNLAVSTDGLIVLDIDTRRGGDAGLQLLEMAQEPLPDTYTVTTPGGGKHYYFKASRSFANSHDKVAPGVDVKAHRGYVVAAGSDRQDGRYAVERDVPLADAPEWLEALCDAPRDPTEGREVVGNELDTKQNIERARAFLQSTEPAVQGAGGDNHTFKTIAATLDYGISVPQALELLHDWNETCQPPWSPEELERKTENAAKYRSKAQGADDPTAEFDAFTPQTKGLEPNPAHDIQAGQIPARRWILGRMALREQVSVLVAPPGAGKSTLTIAAALSVSSGQPILNMPVHEQTAAWLYNNEDPQDELNRRLAAQATAFGIDLSTLKDRLYLNSGEKHLLTVARRTGQGKERMLRATQDVKEMERHITEKKIGLLIVDPFIETHDADENDNVEMKLVIGLYRALAQRTGCAVILVHHTRKLPAGTTDGHAGNMDSGRGASAVQAAARVVRTLYGMSQKDAKRCGVPDAQRHLYVRLDDAKGTMALGTGRPDWFRRESVELPTRDGQPEAVGVLVPVQLTEIVEEDDMDALDQAVAIVCDGRPRLLTDVVRDLQKMPEFRDVPRTTLLSRVRTASSEYWRCEQKAGKDRPGPWRVIPGSDGENVTVWADDGLAEMAE